MKTMMVKYYLDVTSRPYVPSNAKKKHTFGSRPVTVSGGDSKKKKQGSTSFDTNETCLMLSCRKNEDEQKRTLAPSEAVGFLSRRDRGDQRVTRHQPEPL